MISSIASKMSAAEVEFIAEKELVEIEPNFTYSKIYLIQGEFGPFEAGMPTIVPMWLAVNFKQRRRARILPPDWMNVEDLQMKKQEEMESKFFTKMPCPHYIEVAQLLLKYAQEDIPKADEVKTLIKDIWDLRVAKLRSSIDTLIKSESTHAKLNHLTLMEINSVRPVLTNAMDQLHILRTNLHHQESASSQDV